MKHLFQCDQPHCFRRLTFNSIEELERDKANHKCPYWGGQTKVSWSVTKTLVEKMWEMLDKEISAIHSAPISPEWHQARARAFCDAIAIFMVPFFETADEIGKEGMRRYKARVERDTEYETKGMGHRRYETASLQHASAAEGWYGTPEDGFTQNPALAGQKAGTTRTRVALPPAPELSDETKMAIKMAHQQMPEIFTAKVLADQYKVPLSVIKTLINP